MKGTLVWSRFLPKESGPTVAERYSHSSCYFNNSMYVFGGCTSSATTFNDLWRLDLVNGRWIRPLATGTYPSPKAWASLVAYKDSLILFGGWSHPIPSSLHQAPKFFRQLHLYYPDRNEWSSISSQNCPEGKAGHAATIVSDKMVIFGGCHGFENSCNDIWSLDLKTMSWMRMPTSGVEPLPRYSHSQVALDNGHLLVLGGCGGANKQFSDVWLLNMSSDIWCWQELSIINPERCAPQLWCHPACKVGERLIVASKNCKFLKSTQTGDIAVAAPRPSSSRQSMQQRVSNRMALGEKQGNLDLQHRFSDSPSDTDDIGRAAHQTSAANNSVAEDVMGRPSDVNATCSVRNGMPAIRPNAMSNRQRQLEMLQKYEEKIRQDHVLAPGKKLFNVFAKSPSKNTVSTMCLHSLDISEATSLGRVTWQPIKSSNSRLCDIPEETIFYSLVEGRDELILFGGIQSDLHSMQKGLPIKPQAVSNSVHFLSFREHIL